MSPKAVGIIASLLFFSMLSIEGILHGPEADHSLEECVCCLPTMPGCLVNVGPGSTSNKTYQHVQFETLSREMHKESFTFDRPLPSYLAGSLLKNGFGKFSTSQYEFLSVFDAMAYALRIQFFPGNNSMTVTAKFTKTAWYNESVLENKIPTYRSFMGTFPSLSFWENWQLMTTLLPDNLNVNLVRQGNKLLGISDMDGFNEIDMDTLEYVQYFRYADRLSMTSSLSSLLGVLTSAHPLSTSAEPHLVYNFVGLPGGQLPSLLLPIIALYAVTLLITHRMLIRVKVQRPNSILACFTLALVFYLVQFVLLGMDGQLLDREVNLYRIYVIDTSVVPLQRRLLASFPNKQFTYMHEMAITDSHLILAEFPVTWSIQRIISPLFNDPSKLQLNWNPQLNTTLTIVDKKSGEIKHILRHKLGPYWAYHHIGAFENSDGSIFMDVCTFNSGEHLHSFELRTLRKHSFEIPPNVNRRFVIDVNQDVVRVKNVGPVGFDLPTRNLEKAGSKYTFAYGTGHRNQGDWWNTLVKVNMDTGVTIQWSEEHVWPSQPVFVANPERKSEDDGVLVTLMVEGSTLRSFVLVLDAKSMQEISRAYVPIVLPYTSHGYFDVSLGGDADASVVPGVKNKFHPHA